MTRAPRVIAFVANDFRSKAGPLVLSAMEAVRRVRPDLELLVLGSERSAGPDQLGTGVRWLGHVPRDELLRLFREDIDVLCHPTNFDGLPLVVLEALSHGIPAIVSDYAAMPFMAPQSLVVRQHDRAALCRTILDVVDPSKYHALAAEAVRLFDSRFSGDVVKPRLFRSYEDAITRVQGTSPPGLVARPLAQG